MKRHIIPQFYYYLPLLIGSILQLMSLTVLANCDSKQCTYSVSLNKAGFYIPVVKLAVGAKEGFWGLSLNTSSGLNEGGFNAGGVLGENATFPGFIGFYLTQFENIKISAYEYTGNVKQLTVSIKDAQDNFVFNPTAFTSGETKDSGTLTPGFYTATVYSTSGDPRGRFGISLTGNSFGGGVNVGGWIDAVTGGTGEGFGGLYVSSSQTVTLQVLFGESYGSDGAGQPTVDIYHQDSTGVKALVWPSTGASTLTQPTLTQPTYQCLGKIYCSEMTSCKEATYYLKNCPGTLMDGDNDGIPCETQWCGH
jgi:hypothetical protein